MHPDLTPPQPDPVPLDSPPPPARWTPLLLLATGLGAGYSPILPGTCGALWGLPLTWLLLALPARWEQAAAMVALAAVGPWICGAASRALGQKDPSAVVYDEIASVPLVFLPLAPDALEKPAVWVCGFLLIRVLDIVKPPPVGQLEKLPGGLGIMADDLAAGAMAGLGMWLAQRWL
ncbi:MAG: phosphatidylglycerophosphatase A [Pirellulales bacterium]